MPNLDVSDILLDPDFCETVLVQRSQQGVNNQGMDVTQLASIDITAVVIPDGSLDLNRTADAEYLKGKIHLYSQFPLTSGSDTITADVVFWNAQRYIITAVDDFTHFGVGFVDATADLYPTHGQAG